MCGRYVLVLRDDGTEEIFFERDLDPDLLKRLMEEGRARVQDGSAPRRSLYESYNIAPTQSAPIVISRNGVRQLELARWSFVPDWWREDAPPKFATFNARDDKLQSSRFWRGALNSGRCMVPASGFYEWRRGGKQSQPFYIHRKDGKLMGFAGLYSTRTDPRSGEISTSFTIITTATNRFMERVHDRIPLTLGGVSDELWSVWLDPMSEFADVQRMVKSVEWPDMAMRPVANNVNSTARGSYINEPHLIDPAPEQGELL